jgi:hypothetical protein
VKRLPAALAAVAKGELHLTGLLMLGPHLTDANHVELLGRAKFRTKKEIAKLIRSLAPLPDVPDQIEPLRPALPRSLRRPTWAELVESFCPPVRELKPGERPSDWVNDGECPFEGATEASDVARAGLTTAPARVPEVPHQLPPITGPQVYQMQFTTSEEHVELVERAKALLANQASLGEVHLQAMRLLVEVLEKRRFGAGIGRPSHQLRSIRASAVRAVKKSLGTSLPPSGAPSLSAMKVDAPSSTNGACVALKPATSRLTTWSPSPAVAVMSWRISGCAARLTTL